MARGFYWACRLISLAWQRTRPSISNLIHKALCVQTWRGGCSKCRGENHGNYGHSFEHGGIPPAPVLEHKEAPRRDLDARSLSSVSSTNLEQSDSEVPGGRVKLWRVMVGMEQRDSTWRAIITRYFKGTDDGGKMKDKVLNSNSRRQGRTENRTSPLRFSASRALRETKPR